MSSYIGKLAECEYGQGPFATEREAREFFAGGRGELVVLEVHNATAQQQLADQLEMFACLLRGSKNQVLIENEMHGLEIAFQLYREGLIDKKKHAA
jgi:phosphoribosylamine-glycine ligase